MAWHRIDYDALWASDKIARCSDEAQADYAWVYGVADAWGCFELSNLRVIHGRVAAIRKGLSFERLEQDFKEYRINGLCFLWQGAGKSYGYWTGCEKRLPPISARCRYARSTPAPPEDQLERYLRSFSGMPPQPVPKLNLDAVMTGSRPGHDNSNGTGTVTEHKSTHSPSRPAAEVGESGAQPYEFQFEGEHAAQPQLESHRGENSQRKPNPRVLLEIYEQERGPLSPVRAESTERLNKCRRRILGHASDPEKFLADFRAAVRKASQLAWREWKPGFDWFIGNDTNYLKVLEGNYDQWANAAPHPGGAVSGRGSGKTPAAAHSNEIGIHRKTNGFGYAN